MTGLDPELLKLLTTSPFMTVEPGDTVIMCLGAEWDSLDGPGPGRPMDALGTYLQEWSPEVKWQAILDSGFTGVIHVKAPRREPFTVPSMTE